MPMACPDHTVPPERVEQGQAKLMKWRFIPFSPLRHDRKPLETWNVAVICQLQGTGAALAARDYL